MILQHKFEVLADIIERDSANSNIIESQKKLLIERAAKDFELIIDYCNELRAV
jgi:hypothetical protein